MILVHWLQYSALAADEDPVEPVRLRRRLARVLDGVGGRLRGCGRRTLAPIRELTCGLPLADSLLLLPRLPSEAAVLSATSRWSLALDRWSVRVVAVHEADLFVGSRISSAQLRHRPSMVLLSGRTSRLRLSRAGYVVTRYRFRRLPWGVVLAAADEDGLRLGACTWANGVPARWPVVRWVISRGLTVACLADEAPSTVAEFRKGNGGHLGSFCLAIDPRDERRRAVFLLGEGARRPSAVLKVPRSSPSEDRGLHEQALLAKLPATAIGPEPIGSGCAGLIPWSAETVRVGLPLADVLRMSSAETFLSIVSDIGERLTDLAAVTARPAVWSARDPAGDAVLALRGDVAALKPLLNSLHDVPSVFTHGDLASGDNVVVDESGGPSILDWENGRDDGLPLLDLLPFLSTWLARADGQEAPHHVAATVLAVSAGRSVHSPWLFDRVLHYARRVQVPAHALGPLGRLAWGYQASMRLVRDELLSLNGQVVVAWTSVGELVAESWLDDVGPEWTALQAYALK